MNEILLEYYAGKPKEFIKCEGYLREIIKLIKEDHESMNPIRNRNVYRDAEPCKKLEQELAKFFKVSEIKIYWNTGTINAYTLPGFSFTAMDRRRNYLSGKFQNIRMYLCIYEDLVYKANLTEQELMAVILHEIGHNFYYCPITAGFELYYAVMSLGLGPIIALISRALSYQLPNLVADFIKKNLPMIANIEDAFSDIFANVNSIVSPFVGVGNLAFYLASRLLSIVRNPAGEIINSITGYGNEKAADSLAAKYGYGPEQASALHKMTLPENLIGSKMLKSMGPFGSIIDDTNKIMADIVYGMTLDPHPSNNQRAASMLKKLQKDLDSGDYPPEAKRDLQKEIDRMQKAFDVVNDSNVQSNVQIKKAWYEILNQITKNHTDLREMFNFYFEDGGF